MADQSQVIDLVRDVYERLGSIEAQLVNGSQRHTEFSTHLNSLREDFTALKSDIEAGKNKAAGVLLAMNALAAAGGALLATFAAPLKKALWP